MLPEMTPAVERSLAAARIGAASVGSSEVQPVHLLRGLLEEDEGRAACLLRDAGLDPVAARESLAVLLLQEGKAPAELERSRSSAGASSSPCALSAATTAILESARELAQTLTLESIVASESLLLALLREEIALRETLLARGLSFDRLETALLAQQIAPPDLEEALALPAATEQIDAHRVLDAAANRAREALRVVEDYCRFVLDDAFLSGELKRLRHDLTAVLAEIETEHLLSARETLRDVGTNLTTESEGTRLSLKDVALVNLKRLQEALRSLEEHGKLIDTDLGRSLESLRYRSYTLERVLVLGASARSKLADARLQVLLTRSTCAASLDWTIREAAAGGASIFQLREKERSDRELLELGCNVRRWTREVKALFIVNDRPDIARLVEADGVHLGQDDLPVKEARRIVGSDALIGVSTHTLEQLRQAILDGASYIGVGPTFASGTKPFAELAGLEFVRQATAETTLPSFVIGGVNDRTIGTAVSAGAKRVAVSQVVCQADDPRTAVADLLRALRA
jgi:thiamine-phosphate pyrophosphorylase